MLIRTFGMDIRVRVAGRPSRSKLSGPPSDGEDGSRSRSPPVAEPGHARGTSPSDAPGVLSRLERSLAESLGSVDGDGGSERGELAGSERGSESGAPASLPMPPLSPGVLAAHVSHTGLRTRAADPGRSAAERVPEQGASTVGDRASPAESDARYGGSGSSVELQAASPSMAERAAEAAARALGGRFGKPVGAADETRVGVSSRRRGVDMVEEGIGDVGERVGFRGGAAGAAQRGGRAAAGAVC